MDKDGYYVRRRSELELEMEQAIAKLRDLADNKYLMHEIHDDIDDCIAEMEVTKKNLPWYVAHAINERRETNGKNQNS